MGNPTTGAPGTLGASLSSVNSAASSTTLLAQNLNRRGVMIHNTDTNTLYVAFSATATASIGGYSVPIASGGFWEMPPNFVYTGIITGIWAADGSGGASITEV